jgi:peptidoglycan/xylan/chitin deacetylase (PgdA/CDA1 family)
MKFLIRDDDACAITSPKEIIDCYQGIWDQIPVGLAVTPFRIPGDHPCVAEPFRGNMEVHPLEDNQEMVAFFREMRNEGKIDILLHGYDHSTPGGLPEYVAAADLLNKTRKGKAYLEEILGFPIDTFVPPNNGIGRTGLEAIIACGLNLVNLPALLNPKWRRPHPENIPHFMRTQYYKRIRRMRFPHVLNFHDHKEVGYISATPSQTLDALLDQLEKCRAEDGIFIVALHYHAFGYRLKSGETVREALHILLDKAHGFPGIEFPTYTEMWKS